MKKKTHKFELKSDIEPFWSHFSAFYEYFRKRPNKWGIFTLNFFDIDIIEETDFFVRFPPKSYLDRLSLMH